MSRPGKSRIRQNVQGDIVTIFSRQPKGRDKILEKGPLKRARASLVRNLLVVLVKSMLAPRAEPKEFWRQRAALECVKILQPEIWRKTLAADMTRLYQPLSSTEELTRGCRILLSDPELWTFLDEGQQTRLKAFVRDLPEGELTYIEDLLEYGPLAGSAGVRAAKMTVRDFKNAWFFVMPPPVRERLVSSYAASATFDEANAWGAIIQTSAGDLQKAEVKRILEAIKQNGQIRGSFQLRPVIQALRKTNQYPDPEFNALLLSNDLEEFVV